MVNKEIYTFPTTMRHSAIHGAKREFMTKSIHDALHQFIQSVALLRLRGFLHALRLVEMTILKKRHLERSREIP